MRRFGLSLSVYIILFFVYTILPYFCWCKRKCKIYFFLVGNIAAIVDASE